MNHGNMHALSALPVSALSLMSVLGASRMTVFTIARVTGEIADERAPNTSHREVSGEILHGMIERRLAVALDIEASSAY
jgi:hypothetical protein